jgi:gluconate 5-dehydrogenase
MSGAFSLAGRKALVTGANSGIGCAIALGLARQGADIILHHLGAPEGAGTARASVLALGRDAAAFDADFLVPGNATALATEALARFERIDIRVANAAIERRLPWREAGAEHLAMHLSANLASLIDLCRALVPPMQARGWGRVVAIGSILATRPRAETFAYAAIKAAQATTIRALARDVAGQGVTMNIVSPGAIETERLAERYADPAFLRAVVARVPAGRQGRPADCVGPVLFLCSDEAAYVTGADLPVDGGWSIGDPPGVLPGAAA